jgi:hypothetical protein
VSDHERSWRRDGVMSRSAVNDPNVSDGTPQSNGSVATPPIPARPATSCVNAKLLSVDEVVRVNVAPAV